MTKKQNTLELLFPALILIVVMFISILLGSVLIMREKKSKAYFRNRILPTKNHIFIAGTYITALIIVMIQTVIILLIGMTIFHTNIEFNAWNIFITVLLASIMFVSVGMIIGYVSNSEETSTLTALIIAITLLLFSNTLIPIESMSRIAGVIAKYTPFSITEVILRRTLIFGTAINETTRDVVLALIVELAALLATVYYVHTKFFNKKR
jgi:ABC-type multidrug transport system permease subunit